MSYWHGYFAIEDLNLNADQRRTLVDVLKRLGPKSDPQPCRLCHWRISNDKSKAIFEALFNEDVLTVEAMTNRLAAIFDVNPNIIDTRLNSVTFASRPTPIAVFSAGGTDYLRMAVFGGVNATWMESGDECRAYLAANRMEWEPQHA